VKIERERETKRRWGMISETLKEEIIRVSKKRICRVDDHYR